MRVGINSPMENTEAASDAPAASPTLDFPAISQQASLKQTPQWVSNGSSDVVEQ
jgi:hypothetical protein